MLAFMTILINSITANHFIMHLNSGILGNLQIWNPKRIVIFFEQLYLT